MFATEHSYPARIVHLAWAVGIPALRAAVYAGGSSISNCLATQKLRPRRAWAKKFIHKLAPLWGTAKVWRLRFTELAPRTLLLRGLFAARGGAPYIYGEVSICVAFLPCYPRTQTQQSSLIRSDTPCRACTTAALTPQAPGTTKTPSSASTAWPSSTSSTPTSRFAGGRQITRSATP